MDINFFLLLLVLSQYLHYFSVVAQGDLVNCTLCSDGSEPNNLDARADFGDEVLTCRQVHDRGVLALPQENCTFLQSLGSSLCFCNRAVPVPSDCALCVREGEVPPEPLLESFPGETCAEMQVAAQREPGGSRCGAHQRVAGHYCGCRNEYAPTEVCRLCGDGVDLPIPQLAVGDSSCIEEEFRANVNDSCAAARDLYAAACCAATPAPTPSSSAVRLWRFQYQFSGVLSVLVAGILSLVS